MSIRRRREGHWRIWLIWKMCWNQQFNTQINQSYHYTWLGILIYMSISINQKKIRFKYWNNHLRNEAEKDRVRGGRWIDWRMKSILWLLDGWWLWYMDFEYWRLLRALFILSAIFHSLPLKSHSNCHIHTTNPSKNDHSSSKKRRQIQLIVMKGWES